MCPLKREQATRVSYNTLTHSRDSIAEIGRKSRSWIKIQQLFQMFATPYLSHIRRWLALPIGRFVTSLATHLTVAWQSRTSKNILPSSSIWRWQVTWQALIACRERISYFPSASFPCRSLDRHTSINFKRQYFSFPTLLRRMSFVNRLSKCPPHASQKSAAILTMFVRSKKCSQWVSICRKYKILEKRERGHIQGLPIVLNTPYYLRNG